MDIACIIVGVLCLVYYGILVSIGMDFSVIWLIGAIFLVGGGSFLRYARIFGIQIPKVVKIVGSGGLLVGLCCFLILEILIFTQMFSKGKESLDYVIVLGAQVRGDVPSKALRKRIEKAEEYLSANPETKAVLSGGRGEGENRSEARVMYEELVKSGIESDRLIQEDKSTNTVENLKFSAEICGKEKEIGLISQNFHIYRALGLGKYQGYQDICGIAAPSELLYQPHYMVREAFAIVKEIITGNMSYRN